MTPLGRRVAKLEALAAALKPAPHVLRVPFGQTIGEARADFNETFNPEPSHRTLVVPSRQRTRAEQEVWAERFRAQQRRLVADARSERGAAPSAPETITPREWPTSPAIRPNGPHVTWRPFL